MRLLPRGLELPLEADQVPDPLKIYLWLQTHGINVSQRTVISTDEETGQRDVSVLRHPLGTGQKPRSPSSPRGLLGGACGRCWDISPAYR